MIAEKKYRRIITIFEEELSKLGLKKDSHEYNEAMMRLLDFAIQVTANEEVVDEKTYVDFVKKYKEELKAKT